MTVEKQPRTVCYVGRLEKQKNLDTLVEAMQGLNARLIVYGEGLCKHTPRGTSARLWVSM